MLTFTNSEERQHSAFTLLGTATPSHSTRLISENVSLISDNTSLLSSNDSGMDYCSFYSGPSDSTIIAFGEQSESAGSIANSGSSESCGSIAYTGSGESCGSVASSFSGTSYSYSC